MFCLFPAPVRAQVRSKFPPSQGTGWGPIGATCCSVTREVSGGSASSSAPPLVPKRIPCEAALGTRELSSARHYPTRLPLGALFARAVRRLAPEYGLERVRKF